MSCTLSSLVLAAGSSLWFGWAPVAAQTFVVDAANGPGTDFTDIAAAVAAVPNGAVLQVRAGVYAPFAVVGKGMTILGTAGVEVVAFPFAAGEVAVVGTSPSQAVVLRDVALRSSFGGALSLRCQACQGPVSLQRVALDESFYPGIARQLFVDDCAQVLLDACGPFHRATVGAAIAVVTSDVVCIDCGATGTFGPGARATNSTLHLVGGTILGGGGSAAAIELAGSTLRLTGGVAVLTPTFGGPLTALGGAGAVWLDPGASLLGSVGAGVQVSVRAQPVVRSSGGTLGTTAQATLEGTAGGLGVLCLGVPGPPQSLVGFEHGVWLANAPLLAVVSGLFTPTLAAGVPVPPSPLLLGDLFAWQGAAFEPGVGFVVSNASMFTP